MDTDTQELKEELLNIFGPDEIDEFLVYLDKLRKSGVTNMFGARPYLADAFYPMLNDKWAGKVLVYWMHTFSERHPKGK